MPPLPKSPQGIRGVIPSPETFDEQNRQIQANRIAGATLPLHMEQGPDGVLLWFSGQPGTQLLLIYLSATDTGSGQYKGGFAVQAIGPISASTNLTTNGGGNDLYTAPTGDAATAIRAYWLGEANLTGTRHDLPLNKYYYAIPSLSQTDGTNTFAGYEIISPPIDAPCVTP